MGLLMAEAVVSSPSVFAVALVVVVAVCHLHHSLPRHLGPRLVQMADQVESLVLVLVAVLVLVVLVALVVV